MKMLLPALAVLSSTAMAADLKWNVEGRFDYGISKVKHENTTSSSSYEDKRGEFYSNVLRLNSVFTISENLSGRFRYRFSTSQETTSKNRDLTFQNLDFFYIDHKNQWFTTRLGKSNQIESLGREFFVAGTDYPVETGTGAVVSYASMNSGVYNLVKADADLYHVGASAIYTAIPGQTFTISAFNPVKSTTYTDVAAAGDDAKFTKTAWGAYWNGTFLGGLVQPTLGYTQFGLNGKTDTTTSPDSKNKLMAAGIRSVVAGFTIDADWKQYKRENTAANPTATSTTEDKTTSYWANVAYTWDMLTPSFNYIHDKYDAISTTGTDYKRDAWALTLAIKPIKDANFRYHVGYSHDVKKNAVTSGDTKITGNMMFAGIKFDI